MYFHVRFDRHDWEPLGSFESVRRALLTLFPGLSFEWSRSSPEMFADAEAGGIALSEEVRRILEATPPLLRGKVASVGFEAHFSLGPSEPVRSVGVIVGGDFAVARAQLEALASRNGWAFVIEDGPREEPPAGCPRCRSPRTVRLIWRPSYLRRAEDEKDMEAGAAIVVAPEMGRSYEPWLALMRRRAGNLPAWACLDCAPAWSEVHQMAMRDIRWQADKEDAIMAMQFDRAARLRDEQYRERDRWVAAVARLLNESDATEDSSD